MAKYTVTYTIKTTELEWQRRPSSAHWKRLHPPKDKLVEVSFESPSLPQAKQAALDNIFRETKVRRMRDSLISRRTGKGVVVDAFQIDVNWAKGILLVNTQTGEDFKGAFHPDGRLLPKWTEARPSLGKGDKFVRLRKPKMGRGR
jgi:hypothetical protein